MKSKPDILVVLTIVVGLGVLVSSYGVSDPDPEQVAAQFAIR